MAAHDLPALINTALNISKASNLWYVGHSMGTTSAFAAFSKNKDLGKKVNTFYALAPVTTVKHIEGPLKWMAPFTRAIDVSQSIDRSNRSRSNRYLAGFLQPLRLRRFHSERCTHQTGRRNHVLGSVDESSMRRLDGVNLWPGIASAEYGKLKCKICYYAVSRLRLLQSRIPVYVSHTPAGSSTLTVGHYGQMVDSGKFDMFDYGVIQNAKKYGQVCFSFRFDDRSIGILRVF